MLPRHVKDRRTERNEVVIEGFRQGPMGHRTTAASRNTASSPQFLGRLWVQRRGKFKALA